MRVLKETPLTFGYTTWRFEPSQDALVVIVKGTFDLVAGGRATFCAEPEPVGGDVYDAVDAGEFASTADELGGLRYASDGAPFKPKADAMLTGVVHTPNGRELSACSASFKVGSTGLQLTATGDRYWLEPDSGAISDPKPFSAMPVSYARAFGGASHAANPAGKGVFPATATKVWERPLPNIEDARTRVTSPSSRPAPAGFGPLAAHWSYRLSRWPAFDQRWLEERWPWAPHDLDYSYFNAAQPALQVDGYLEGNERITCENLHRAHRRYSCELPHIRPRCFVIDEQSNDQAAAADPAAHRFREANLRLDTLWVDMEAEKLVLVWRGNLPVVNEELEEVRYAYVCAESLDEARLPERHYRQRFELARATAEGEVPAAAPPQAPAGNDNDAPFVVEDELTADMDPTEVDAVEVVEEPPLLPDAIRTLMERSGTSPEVIALVAKGDAAGAQAKMAELYGLKPADLDQMMEEARDRMKAQIAAAGEDPSVLDARPPNDRAPLTVRMQESDAPWSRGRVEMCLATNTSLAGVDLSGLDLSGLDFSGRDMRGTILKAASLKEAWLEGTSLIEATLAGAVATRAKLKGAVLTNADASGLDAVECDLTEANLAGAVFDKALLSGAQLDRVAATGASFVAAQLDGVTLLAAVLCRARLDGAVLDNAVLRDADLTSAQAEAISAVGADFSKAVVTKFNASEGSVLTNAKLRGIEGKGSHWMGGDFRGADFSAATLPRTDLSRCKLAGANLSGSDLRHSDFTLAQLPQASLAGANLTGCRFERADLRTADLRGAMLFEAELWRADLSGAKLDGASVAGTLLGTPVQAVALAGQPPRGAL